MYLLSFFVELQGNVSSSIVYANYQSLCPDWLGPREFPVLHWILRSWPRPQATSRLTRHFPIFWTQKPFILTSQCHSALSDRKKKTVAGDRQSSSENLESPCYLQRSCKHEYFQANRRPLPLSSYHHPAAKNMENQVLCR